MTADLNVWISVDGEITVDALPTPWGCGASAAFSCSDCLHSLAAHAVDGCTVRDDLGNRCACVQDGHR